MATEEELDMKHERIELDGVSLFWLLGRPNAEEVEGEHDLVVWIDCDGDLVECRIADTGEGVEIDTIIAAAVEQNLEAA